MQDDPIVNEVRRVRARHEAKFGHDIRAILNDAKRLEDRCHDRVVSFAGKPKPALPPRQTAASQTSVWKDPVVEEIHQLREAQAARFNFDPAAILADARQRQSASGRVVSYLKAKKKAA